ncbi:MAG: Rpn family recombination-promoting nuclease/putative transposase [Prevotella sp.]|nr:Rpn family recombination-promoting nuclease/putative transposase [Prevotella sp.]
MTDVERTKLLEAKIEGEKQGRAKGRAEGLAEGMEKGIEKNSIDIAKKMKLKGMSSDLIAEMTGLTINDIESL